MNRTTLNNVIKAQGQKFYLQKKSIETLTLAFDDTEFYSEVGEGLSVQGKCFVHHIVASYEHIRT